MKYFLLSLLFSLSSYSDRYCELPFIEAFSKIAARDRIQYKEVLESLHRDFKETKDPSVAVDIFEDNYEYLEFVFNKEKSYLLAELEEDNLPLEFVSLIKKEIEIKVIKDYEVHFNNLVDQAFIILQEMGVPARITYVKKAGGLNQKIIVVEAEKSQLNSHAVEKIKRYNQRFNTKVVTIDLYETIRDGSEAFFINGRVELGAQSVRGLALDDVMMLAPKHEFSHAAFAAKREKKQGSLYHTQFNAIAEENLSSIDTSYNKFMRAEELYNFANNSFWGSEKLINPMMFTPIEILKDISMINRFLPGTRKIAQQTVELTSNLSKGYEHMLEELKKGEFNLGIFDARGKVTRDLEEVHELIFVDNLNLIEITEFIGPEIRILIEKMIKQRIEIEARFTGRIGPSTSEEETAKIFSDFLREENLANLENHKKIIEYMMQRNLTLGRVAKVVEAESDVTIQKSVDYLERMVKLAKQSGDDFQLDSIELKALVEEYRRLGNLVKEDYKGFAGKKPANPNELIK